MPAVRQEPRHPAREKAAMMGHAAAAAARPTRRRRAAGLARRRGRSKHGAALEPPVEAEAEAQEEEAPGCYQYCESTARLGGASARGRTHEWGIHSGEWTWDVNADEAARSAAERAWQQTLREEARALVDWKARLAPSERWSSIW